MDRSVVRHREPVTESILEFGVPFMPDCVVDTLSPCYLHSRICISNRHELVFMAFAGKSPSAVRIDGQCKNVRCETRSNHEFPIFGMDNTKFGHGLVCVPGIYLWSEISLMSCGTENYP